MGRSTELTLINSNLAEVVEVPPTRDQLGVVWVDSPRLSTRLESTQQPEESLNLTAVLIDAVAVDVKLPQ